MDEQCLYQEVVLFVIKVDICEEFDCFYVYVGVVWELFDVGGVIGWCFDFFVQEFNWEVNILCLKFNDVDFMVIGLDLKVVID